ncbi:hypothetical protein R1sor_014746 [Riccia sorocarpa]|uniref:Uncharacterized protein n=1 Tax=Riccia sorocarpa TaxID=122646 RepID=A0ABD3HD89_9MARC
MRGMRASLNRICWNTASVALTMLQTNCFLCTLKNRLGVRTPAKPRRRSVARPKDFVTLRRKLLARWSQTVSRKWQAFLAEAEKSALCRSGPEPKAPEYSPFTVLIDGLLLLDRRCDVGFWADIWNFELQECVLTACVKSTTVETWCHTLENHIRLQPNEWPSKELNPKLRLAVRALKGIFPTVLLVETDIVRSFMAPLRNQMIQSGIKHLEWLRANLIWLENCSPHRIAERARPVHLKWVQTAKEILLPELRTRLVQKFCSQFVATEEEAITKARLDDIVFDNDSEENIVLDSGGVSEDSVSHGQVTIPAPGDYIVSLSQDESGKQDNANDLVPTPEKWIIPVVTSDDEAFQRRLSTIYVNEDGVASQPEGLWPSEATDLLVSQVVRDMRTTFASFFPEQLQRT